VEAEVVFSLYLALYCSGLTGTSHLTLSMHALQATQIWLKSVNSEGNFT
jgi:hypothetical protein